MTECRFSLSDKEPENFNHRGIFHRWGQKIDYADGKAHVVTCAIIENEFGRIYELSPSRIKLQDHFLDRIKGAMFDIVELSNVGQIKKKQIHRSVENFFHSEFSAG
jgi:hypothetical protein